MELNVCAIVVTYNRKVLLDRCIRAILSQNCLVKSIYIIDNASIDGTFEYLKTKGLVDKPFRIGELVETNFINGVSLHYYRMSSNMGGAGGFSRGLQLAYESNEYDAFWLMDDDGYPSSSCLKKQVEYLSQYDYVMPVSIDVDNHLQMSWPTVMKNGQKSLLYKDISSSWGEIMTYIYPFNGSLLSKKIVDRVGYINKELFIWGDEYEHYWRCRKKGFQPITVTDAVFYHPANKMSFVPILFGLIKVPFSESKLKMVCLARNYTHIYMKYDHKYKILLKFFLYTWLFLITRKFDIVGYKLYIASVKDGLVGDFTRHLKYLK